MKVIEIVRAHLVAGGYDGLVFGESECGCELADLAPCDDGIRDCRPAYRGADRGSPDDWAMYASKDDAQQSMRRDWGDA